MEKGVRKLTRMSTIMRNWTILSNYAVTLQNVPQTCASYSQDTLLLKELKSFNKNVERFNHLHSYNNPINILQIVKNNNVNMNGKSALKVMTSLFKALKEQSNCESIKESKEFLYLCEVIRKDVRHLDTSEVVNVLKVMTYLKVPSNTVIVQTLLQFLRISINDLPIEKIPFIYFLIKQHERVPLVKALLTALPCVFEIHVKRDLDTENLTSLVQCLAFSSTLLNENATNIIANALSTYGCNIDSKNALSIYRSLVRFEKLSLTSTAVFLNAQHVLCKQAKELSYKDICRLLRDICKKIMNEQMDYYHEPLIEALSNAALNLDLTLSEGIHIVNKLNNMNYSNIPLLEYLAGKSFQDPSVLTNCAFVEMQNFIRGFTIADYKPVFWNTIRETILDNNISRYASALSALEFALDLISLDCYHADVIKQAFSISIYDIPKNKRDIELSKLVLLYQSIKTLYPKYSGPWPSMDMIEPAMFMDLNSQTYSLNAVLEQAMGGPEYVKNQLKTKLGHIVDHVVVIKPGGQPIAINYETATTNDIEFVEDIQPPVGSRTLLIFNFPEHAYTRNYHRLKSTWQLKLRSAEALTGFSTIAINSCSWLKLSDYEKIPYLKQAIRLKCDDVSVAS